LVGACSDKSSDATALTSNDTAIAVDENLTTDINPQVAMPTVAPAQPSHRYDYKEGEFYSYLGAVSEEDRKRGVAAPSVVRFRYSGFWDGSYHLQTIGDGDQVIGFAECSKPCVVIKEITPSGAVQHMGYSGTSIIGAAFDDAMTGQLKRAPAVGAVRNGYRFQGGDPSSWTNWRLIDPPAQTPTPMDADDPAYPAQIDTPDTSNASN
jgi:hypothetical protein